MDLQDWIQSEKDLSVAETLSLGFAPFSLDQSGDHRTIVLDAMRYTDKDKVRWGVGARLTLHAWSETGTIKGAVALVASQASLNLVYTRTKFQVIGYNSPDLVNSPVPAVRNASTIAAMRAGSETRARCPPW
jgi:hypothetical protein